jgi:hypothetical protein
MNSFEKQWNDYYKLVVPVNAGPTQLIETRRAFYAGAIALMNVIMKDRCDKDKNSKKFDDIFHSIIKEAAKY